MILSGDIRMVFLSRPFYLVGNIDEVTAKATNLEMEMKEIILSTNSGQIGVLPNHAPIATAVDIGILRIRFNGQWVNDGSGWGNKGIIEITILVNDAEKSSDMIQKPSKLLK
ncbi:hypothetical protein CUMW_275600 [Citrus unshiu]|uniref:ATP synthase F1 complex delta/epsilon subunit N-terminal domain-containing protein n=1 Tax=Citrus unshiu TaxID=55188 RepID=A0A2H5N1W9_CITUN|nr:hypothetical protein CUMW_275600 [Citrus unshiu]